MTEGDQPSGVEQPPQPEAQIDLTPDEWELVRMSVDDYLRSYLEADYTWWEPDDDRPVRLRALLDKLTPEFSTVRGDYPHHWWPGHDIGRFFGVEPRLRLHQVYGPGVRFDIKGDDPPGARLDLYPERKLARYRSGLTRIDLLGVTSVALTDDHHILIESGEGPTAAHLMIYRGGRISYVQFERIQPEET